MLPSVYKPGSVIAPVLESVSGETGLPADCKVVAGTTDSIAAFIATGANEVGDAVTSLGSSLVLKLLSDTPVCSSKLGIYSHRLGDVNRRLGIRARPYAVFPFVCDPAQEFDALVVARQFAQLRLRLAGAGNFQGQGLVRELHASCSSD